VHRSTLPPGHPSLPSLPYLGTYSNLPRLPSSTQHSLRTAVDLQPTTSSLPLLSVIHLLAWIRQKRLVVVVLLAIRTVLRSRLHPQTLYLPGQQLARPVSPFKSNSLPYFAPVRVWSHHVVALRCHLRLFLHFSFIIAINGPCLTTTRTSSLSPNPRSVWLHPLRPYSHRP
jgi:hypothetical protein